VTEQRLKGLAGLVLAALLAVVVVGAVVGSRSAAGDLQVKAERALGSAGLGDVRVTFHGREARLSGGTPGELGKAELVVEGVEGVRWADVVPPGRPVVTEAPDTTPTLDLTRTAQGVSIRGTVPDANAVAGIKARVAEDFAVPVTGDLAIDPAVGTADWIAQLPDVMGDLTGVKRLRLTIEGNGALVLAGAVESRAGADAVRRVVAETVPGLRVVSHLEVRAGDLSEADGAVLDTTTLVFEPHGTTLDAEHVRQVDAVADVLRRHPRIEIEIGGHIGPTWRASGERASRARVAAVRDRLVRSGMAASRITTRTFTSDSTTAGPTAERFRRVDFVVREA
jgi:outer membrane protein OmpA-like peptidoglycan-associated protein